MDQAFKAEPFLTACKRPADRSQGTREAASQAVEACLTEPYLHEQWIGAYRNAANERFFSAAFDFIAREVYAAQVSEILDAGCGTCAHSIRLADRGFYVTAVDISADALATAQKVVKGRGLSEGIQLSRANLRCLPFRNGQFQAILCWGVLMHVPDVQTALAELARVLAPGGLLVMSENNMWSIQSIGVRFARRLYRKGKGRSERTVEGIENWYPTAQGTLLTREIDAGWMVSECRQNGLSLEKRVGAQLSDLYAWLASPLLKRFVHVINLFWFKNVKMPYLSYGNILIFKKK